ncbi:MAG: hypothetical protein A2504_15635 [Bdellovibrionales bacterium RIFOXYD12_FULL_39_22]|nr:MAG: hypothetical protein A2385_03065 [Bdellovibrionales bacterium RIFOXYB1_FULL_39_21]OFZ43225.1 MAG: hypothetical protein A2485_12210 [Bdellovibrionales bacterium RIFOXYC12_FULL_39_17]OFZ47963.1 MAG: hypothetical protein A2404_16850 [Bdellovibrionales bacterium RIFOXYC1_FULL_39_130]OFZ73886.1 MAG: hypothetical protein A2451_06175 [Bdellovibrionales bacterium RIFOXYC2_FULL_39_8]OFZ75743.1 MAG: hypothetical protein A2560_13350 [Bdellovibrionales bacterium RIFOXYD1_FULL_39_84]OFZ94233.1 MAG:
MKVLIALMTVLYAHSLLAGGSLVGNGGDTIFCENNPKSPFLGYYTLDFLLEYKDLDLADYSIDTTFEENRDNIRQLLEEKYPELLPHFDDFFGSLYLRNGVNRSWHEATGELIDINDENIIEQLPENCIRNKKPQIYQTVIRQSIYEPIRYNFDKNILVHQRIYNPLQYSFFLMHEWMWDFTSDVRILRKLNWLMHSKELQKLSRRELIEKFSAWNLFAPKLDYCERSKIIQAYFPKECEKISARDLSSVSAIHFDNIPEGFLFRFGDFYGFGKTSDLIINNTSSLQSMLPPRIFSPMYQLKNLTLVNDSLTILSNEILRDLKYLETLDLRENQGLVINEPFLNLESLRIMKLTLPATLSILPPNLQELHLESNNEIYLQQMETSLKKRFPNVKIICRLISNVL